MDIIWFSLRRPELFFSLALNNFIRGLFSFQYIKNLSKRNIKTTTMFEFHNHMKICAVASVFHLSRTKKYTQTTLVFRPSKSSQKKYIETTSIFRLSKLRWTKYVETTSIFRSSKLHWKSTSKWCGNLSMFSLRRINVILTSNRHRFDVDSDKFNYEFLDSSIWVQLTCYVTRTKWLSQISHLDSLRFESEI